MPALLFSAGERLDMLDDIFALDLESLQNISVASVSKMDQPLKDTPANMVIFTQEKIEKRGFRNVADLLETLPGVTIHNFSTSGYFNSINVRGLTGAHYFKILLDGVEIDQTNGEMISTAMNFPLDGIARVEVLFGPSSVIYGADAVSGVLNLITQDQSGAEVFFSAAEEGYNYSYLRFAKQLGDFKLIARAHLHEDQEYKLDERFDKHFPKEDIVNNSGALVQSADYRTFDYRPSNTASLNLLLKHDLVDVGFNYSTTEDSTLLGQVDKKSYENFFDRDANIMTMLWGVYAKNVSALSGFSLMSTISYDTTTVEEGSYFINRNTDYIKAYKYSESNRFSLEEVVQKNWNAHQLIVGLNYEHYNSMPMSFDMPYPSPSSSYVYPGSDIPLNYFKRSWDNFALFAQDYYTYSDALKFSLALRYDNNSIEGDTFNPRAAIIYQPSEKITHKLIYAEAYLAPSTNDKYKHFGIPFEVNDIPGDTNAYKTDYFRVPNELLEAEKSRTLEYSVFAQIQDNFFAQGSLYYNKLDNLIGEREIQDVEISDVTILNATQIYNSGHGVIQGFDLSLNYDTAFGEATTEFWCNYSYIDGYMKDDIKKELPFIAPHQFNGGVIIGWDRWNFSPSLKWIDQINSGYIPDDSGTREKISGYTLVNFFGSYAFNPNVTASLRATNLTDAYYYNARHGFSSTYKTPQLGRTIILGLKAEF